MNVILREHISSLKTHVRRAGVNVPGIKMVDAAEGVLGIEWIEGKSVRKLLPGGAEDEEEGPDDPTEDPVEEEVDPLKDFGVSVGASASDFIFNFLAVLISLDQLMKLIGIEIAKMHLTDVIHGDLTTSNMMLRHSSDQADLVRRNS